MISARNARWYMLIRRPDWRCGARASSIATFPLWNGPSISTTPARPIPRFYPRFRPWTRAWKPTEAWSTNSITTKALLLAPTILSAIQVLDTSLEANGGVEYKLHHHKGTVVGPDDFEPLTTVLGPNKNQRFAPPGGRPLGAVFPYFNLEWGGEGRIIVVGWPGQWAAQFTRDSGVGLNVIAGQELTHLRLRPGESIRSPLIVLDRKSTRLNSS